MVQGVCVCGMGGFGRHHSISVSSLDFVCLSVDKKNNVDESSIPRTVEAAFARQIHHPFDEFEDGHSIVVVCVQVMEQARSVEAAHAVLLQNLFHFLVLHPGLKLQRRQRGVTILVELFEDAEEVLALGIGHARRSRLAAADVPVIVMSHSDVPVDRARASHDTKIKLFVNLLRRPAWRRHVRQHRAVTQLCLVPASLP